MTNVCVREVTEVAISDDLTAAIDCQRWERPSQNDWRPCCWQVDRQLYRPTIYAADICTAGFCDCSMQ